MIIREDVKVKKHACKCPTFRLLHLEFSGGGLEPAASPERLYWTRLRQQSYRGNIDIRKGYAKRMMNPIGY